MSLETLLRVLLAVTAILTIASLANVVLARGSAALRHRLWSLSVVAVLAVPLLVSLLPQWKLGWLSGLESQPADVTEVAADSPVAPATPAVNGANAESARNESVRRRLPDESSAHRQPSIPALPRNRMRDDRREQPAVSSSLPVQPVRSDRTSPTETARTEHAAADVPATASSSIAVFVVWGMWLAGAAVVLVRLAMSLWQARRIVRHSSRIPSAALPVSFAELSTTLATRCQPELLESPLTDSPLCIGSLRPRIVLPVNRQGWSADELRCVLLHELAHVARRDVAWQIAARFACAVYWFHPLVWLAAWRMRVERETACDDAVLTLGEPSARYARLLLNLAAELSRSRIRENSAAQANAAAIPMAAGSRVEQRIRAVLSPHRRRSAVNRWTGRTLAAAALAIAAFAAVLNPMEAAPTADVPYASGTQQPAGSAAAASNQKKQSAKASVVKDKSQTELPVRVTGVVVDEKGNPVAGAQVRVTGAFLLRKKVTTGADGRFAIPVKQKQARGILVAARNIDGTRQALIRRSPNPRSREPITNLRLTLRPARTISLTVLDAAGKPVAGVWTAAIVSYRDLDEMQTDARGRAVLHVPAGTNAPLQAVIAAKDGIGLDYVLYRRPNEPASDPYRLAQDDAKPLTLVLNGAQTVTVRVVDEAGKAVKGVTVYPWHFSKPKKGNVRFGQVNLSGVQHFFLKTDERGIATYRAVPADQTGRIQFRAHLDGYYMPRNERDFHGPQKVSPKVTLRLLKLLPITGRVTLPDGKPAANIDVQISGAGYQFDSFHGTARTGADGRFRIGVYPNQYYQFVAGNRKWASAGVSTVILKKAPPEVQLHLQPATRVFGRVTLGTDKSPAGGRYLQLMKRDAEDYHKLPKEKRLPNPSDSNRAVAAYISQSAQTDTDGRFEFFVGPGRYYITGVAPAKPPQFEIAEQKEFEVNIHASGPESGPVAGRVVLRGKPDQGVANVSVRGVPRHSRLRSMDAMSDKSGRFSATRGLAEMVVYARSSEGKLQGLMKLAARDRRFVIPIGPCASARGRVVDEATGKPLGNRQIQYGIRITYTDGTFWTTTFGGSTKTDANGRFTADGLVPGWKYELNLVVGTDGNGQARGWTTVGSVTAKKVETVELGTIKVKPPYREPTIDDRIQTYFNKKKPLKERLAAAREQAELLHKRVLMIVGRPKLAATKELFSLRFDDDSGVSAAFGNYAMLCLDATRPALAAAGRAFAQRNGLKWPKSGGVALAVLDGGGKLVGQTSISELSTGGKLSSIKLKRFLDEHKPEFPDAGKLLADALAQAKKQGKSVLLQHSGPQCYPCLLLSRFLKRHAALIASDYVYVRIDSRYKHGKDVIDRTRPGKERSIPWMVILDAAGKPRITSDGPKGNIGFPSEPEGIAQFRKMLLATRRNLTDGEIQSLLKALDDKR